MITHNLLQGSADWHKFRAEHFGASEIPAVLGISPYKTRTQLLHEKATGIVPDVDAGTQRLFDEGHRSEALARTHMEAILGVELYPCIGSDGGTLSASFDGLDEDCLVCWEHKTLNDSLRGITHALELPEHYRAQMEQQLMVSGAPACYFSATRWDGDVLAEEVQLKYLPDMALRERIRAAWEQFHRDVATYTPTETIEPPKAEAIMQLPAVIINATGGLSVCNLSEITPRFDTFLAGAKTILVTDVDFVNADETAKFSRSTAKTLKLKAKEVVDQIASVSEAVRTLELYAEKFDGLGLKLEKLVKSEKEARKLAILSEVRTAYYAHVAALETETHPIKLNMPAPDFAGAMKGLSKLDSVQNAVDLALANGKIDADKTAKDIRAKLAWCKETFTGFGFLFSDLSQIIVKPMDDFKLLVTSRIESHKAAEQEKAFAEQKRIDAEIAMKVEAHRVKIQAEEEAKARAKTAEEERARMIAEAAKLPPIPQERVGEIMRDMATITPTKEAAKVSEVDLSIPPTEQIVAAVCRHFGVNYDISRNWIIAAAKEMQESA